MNDEGSGSALVRFSTADLPPAEREAFLRETFGRHCMRTDIEPRSDQPMQQSAALLALPGLNCMWSRAGAPALWSRTRKHLADGNDGITLLMPLTGSLRCAQRGDDMEVQRNAGVFLLNGEPGSIEFHRLSLIGVVVPRAALAGLARNVEKRLIPVPVTVDALRLLRSYLTFLYTGDSLVSPELTQVMVPHIHDLFALALGATRDGAELALGRGVRAARLKAVKDDLAAQPSLSVAALAERQGVTPRYLQLLFEAEGTTFTAYALDQRLSRARRLLINPRYTYWTISSIALEAGFGDLSHFNRNFRRRFGASPSEVRAGSLN